MAKVFDIGKHLSFNCDDLLDIEPPPIDTRYLEIQEKLIREISRGLFGPPDESRLYPPGTPRDWKPETPDDWRVLADQWEDRGDLRADECRLKADYCTDWWEFDQHRANKCHS